MPSTCTREGHDSKTRAEFIAKIVDHRLWPSMMLEAGECPHCGSTLNWPMPGYAEWDAAQDLLDEA